MTWGAQTRNCKAPTNPRTWGAQTKPGRGQIRRRTEDGEVFNGTRKWNWRGKEKG